MKKLIIPCFLIVSLTISAQYLDSRTINFGDNLSTNFKDITSYISNSMDDSIFEVEFEEEEDAPFDFDVQEYLPKDFNPFKLMYNTYDIVYEYFFEEEDASFDFDTKAYLPVGFNPYEDKFIIEEYALLNEESDATFDFDTKEYLPEGFNAYDENESILAEYELLNVEEDEPFDFNTVAYLPVSFDAQR
jgi:hypothetical protein